MQTQIQDKINTLLNDFTELKTWEAKYKKIIEMGRSLPPLSESEKIEINQIKGCQSQVWLVATVDNVGLVHFKADSDALISKGLVSILLTVYSEEQPITILNTPPNFIQQLSLDQHLTPSRSNGLYSMIKQIFVYAQAFQAILNSKN